MEKRIELERRGRNPSTIAELNLDNCKSTNVIGLTDKWEKLETLSMMNIGLTTLKGFPKLSALKRLELSENRLMGGLEPLSSLKNMSHLTLTSNKIKEFSALEPLKNLERLISLDLFNCEVCNVENYREKTFTLIPSLIYLDGYDKDDNECEEEEIDGVDGEEIDDEDLDEEEIDEEEDGEEEEEDVPLNALYNTYDPEGDDDYEAADVEDEEEEDIDEENENAINTSTNDDNAKEEVRGTKRKLDAEEQAD